MLKLNQPNEQLALGTFFNFGLSEAWDQGSDRNEFAVAQVAFAVNELELQSIGGLLHEEVVRSPVVAGQFIVNE